jgi:hypothetical protein
MTEIEPTDSSTGRRRFLVPAIVAMQATVGAAVAFVLGATTLSPSFLRRQDTWLRAADLESLPGPCDYVVPRQHIRMPGRIGLPFLAAPKDAGRMRSKDQCVAFRLHSWLLHSR